MNTTKTAVGVFLGIIAAIFVCAMYVDMGGAAMICIILGVLAYLVACGAFSDQLNRGRK